MAAMFGLKNPQAKHPFRVVERARLLRARGYTHPEIREHLKAEGVEVNLFTLQGWTRHDWRARA